MGVPSPFSDHLQPTRCQLCSEHTYGHCPAALSTLTWKNCSCFSALQKKGCIRTTGAEGRFWGSPLIIDTISSLATTLS